MVCAICLSWVKKDLKRQTTKLPYDKKKNNQLKEKGIK